jgi:hypothetical protein
MRLAVSLVLASAACASQSAAPSDPAAAPAPVADTATPAAPKCPAEPGLCFAVQPADTEILLDGDTRGTVDALGAPAFIGLPSGIYQITLKRQGYATWRAEVSIGSAVENIEVQLVKK